MSDKPATSSEAAEAYLKDHWAREKKPPRQVILAELEDILRVRPNADELAKGLGDSLEWLGRVKAALHYWDSVQATALIMLEPSLHSAWGAQGGADYRKLIALINQARHSIRLEVVPASVVAGQGMVYEYFDGVRKIIERATADLFFVDPYLDADFVTRYLPYAPKGVIVRLLARHKMKTLLPAVDMFAAQNDLKVAVRQSDEFHDRYVFIDEKECFQSGASFHQGANTSGTAVIPVLDAFEESRQLYEGYWVRGKSLR